MKLFPPTITADIKAIEETREQIRNAMLQQLIKRQQHILNTTTPEQISAILEKLKTTAPPIVLLGKRKIGVNSILAGYYAGSIFCKSLDIKTLVDGTRIDPSNNPFALIKR